MEAQLDSEQDAEREEDDLKARAIGGATPVASEGGGDVGDDVHGGGDGGGSAGEKVKSQGQDGVEVVTEEEAEKEMVKEAEKQAEVEDGAVLLSAQKEAEQRHKEEAQRAYEELSRKSKADLNTQNAGLRLVAEEKEKYRQRQTQNIMQRARERKLENVAVDDVADEVEDGVGDQIGDDPPPYVEKEGDAEEPSPPNADASAERDGGGEGLDAVRKRLHERLGKSGGRRDRSDDALRGDEL